MPPMDDTIEAALARQTERQHGVFSIGDLRSLGLGQRWRDNRVAQGRVLAVHAGVYRFAGAPLSWRGKLLAATLAGGPRGRASHRSSAVLLGLPGGRDDLVEITCPQWRRARHDGLVVHETKAFDAFDTTNVDGIPCTTAARTLLDLGAVISPLRVEYALDHALRMHLVTAGELAALLARVGRPGRNGAGVLRAILAEREPGRSAESPPERRMVKMLVANGLPHPVLQYEIHHQGAFVARVDAAYPQWRIAIEYDSEAFHTGEVAHTRDNDRRNLLRRVRWEYVGVRKANLARHCVDVAATIRAIRDAHVPAALTSKTTRS